jgi:hypothetical protein
MYTGLPSSVRRGRFNTEGTEGTEDTEKDKFSNLKFFFSVSSVPSVSSVLILPHGILNGSPLYQSKRHLMDLHYTKIGGGGN